MVKHIPWIPIYIFILLLLSCFLLFTKVRNIEGFEISNFSNFPKILWIYWDDPKPTKLIQQIQDYNKKILQGWDIRFYNRDTIKDIIDPKLFPKNLLSLSVPAQTDWFRLYLLKHYGGCWLDASIIINSNDALLDLYNKTIEEESQLTAFSWHSYDTMQHKSGKTLALEIDSWFIMAPSHSSIIEAWLTEFEKAVDIGFVEYKKGLLKDSINISSIAKVDDENDTYLTVYMCLQKVLQSLETLPPMIILKSEDTMLKVRVDCKYSCECIMNKIKNDPFEVSKIPYIKLVNCDRDTNIDISNYFDSLTS